MRGIPPRTMCDIWNKRDKREKIRTIIRYVPQKEKVSKKVDEEMIREVARGVTEGLVATLGEEIARKILPSYSMQTPGIKQDDRVQIKETFIDPTEETKLEHNFERLGKLKESDTDVHKTIQALKNLRANKNI